MRLWRTNVIRDNRRSAGLLERCGDWRTELSLPSVRGLHLKRLLLPVTRFSQRMGDRIRERSRPLTGPLHASAVPPQNAASPIRRDQQYWLAISRRTDDESPTPQWALEIYRSQLASVVSFFTVLINRIAHLPARRRPMANGSPARANNVSRVPQWPRPTRSPRRGRVRPRTKMRRWLVCVAAHLSWEGFRGRGYSRQACRSDG